MTQTVTPLVRPTVVHTPLPALPAAAPKRVAATAATPSETPVPALACDRTAIARLTGTDFWQSADSAMRQQVWALARSSDPGSACLPSGDPLPARPLELIADLAERGTFPKTASDGRTLLQILSACGPVPTERRVALGALPLTYAVLAELARPSLVTQDRTNGCTVTSLQLGLMRHAPAEYARVVTELFTAGASIMRGGERLRFDANSSQPYAGDTRLGTSRALQSALMQHGLPDLDYVADGGPGSFEGVRKISTLPLWAQILAWLTVLPGLVLFLWQKTADGLPDTALLQLARQLYGQPYALIDGKTKAARAKLLREEIAHNKAVLVSVFWPSANKGHTLELAAVMGDRLILRDPALPSQRGNSKKGELIASEPGMTLFDGPQSLVACPLADPNVILTFAGPDFAP